jgi:heme-degrading monooxygenase HmoA
LGHDAAESAAASGASSSGALLRRAGNQIRVTAFCPGTATRRKAMPDIRENNGVVTQITAVKLPPDNQEEVLRLMIERSRFMATQPGFVSVNLHRSRDGSHVVNYIQWTNADKLAAAHHSPEFRKNWPRFGELVKEIEPCLYDVVHIVSAA